MTHRPIVRYKGESNGAAMESDFTEIVRAEIGLKEPFAIQIAAAMVRGLRKKFPAQQIYILPPDSDERNAAIRREFNGKNLEEVCCKFGVSRQLVHQIAGE